MALTRYLIKDAIPASGNSTKTFQEIEVAVCKVLSKFTDRRCHKCRNMTCPLVSGCDIHTHSHWGYCSTNTQAHLYCKPFGTSFLVKWMHWCNEVCTSKVDVELHSMRALKYQQQIGMKWTQIAQNNQDHQDGYLAWRRGPQWTLCHIQTANCSMVWGCDGSDKYWRHSTCEHGWQTASCMRDAFALWQHLSSRYRMNNGGGEPPHIRQVVGGGIMWWRTKRWVTLGSWTAKHTLWTDITGLIK